MSNSNRSEKLIAVGITFVAGWLAQKVIEKVWNKSTGGISHNIDDDDARIASVVAFSAVSAIAATLTQVAARRGSKSVVSKFISSK